MQLFLKHYFPLALLVLGISLYSGSLWLIQYSKTKMTDQLISVCSFEIKKNLNHPDTATFDYASSYVIETSNPNMWIVHLGLTAENDGTKEKESVRMFCRMRKINGNIQIDKYGLTN